MNITLYRVIIESLNAMWDINREQLKKLPIYEKCFGFSGFRNESTMKESTNEDGIKTIIHTLERKEFSYAENLKPIDLKYLEDITWIFNLEEDKWNMSQRRVYNALNPEYEIETSSKRFVCSRLMFVITERIGFIILVLSSLPPSPTSIIAISTFSLLK